MGRRKIGYLVDRNRRYDAGLLSSSTRVPVVPVASQEPATIVRIHRLLCVCVCVCTTPPSSITTRPLLNTAPPLACKQGYQQLY